MTGVNFISAIRLESKCNASDSIDDSQRCAFDSDETKIKNSNRGGITTPPENSKCVRRRGERHSSVCVSFHFSLSLSLSLSLSVKSSGKRNSHFFSGFIKWGYKNRTTHIGLFATTFEIQLCFRHYRAFFSLGRKYLWMFKLTLFSFTSLWAAHTEKVKIETF